MRVYFISPHKGRKVKPPINEYYLLYQYKALNSSLCIPSSTDQMVWSNLGIIISRMRMGEEGSILPAKNEKKPITF
jgi:hypothetical protein